MVGHQRTLLHQKGIGKLGLKTSNIAESMIAELFLQARSKGRGSSYKACLKENDHSIERAQGRMVGVPGEVNHSFSLFLQIMMCRHHTRMLGTAFIDEKCQCPQEIGEKSWRVTSIDDKHKRLAKHSQRNRYATSC